MGFLLWYVPGVQGSVIDVQTRSVLVVGALETNSLDASQSVSVTHCASRSNSAAAARYSAAVHVVMGTHTASWVARHPVFWCSAPLLHLVQAGHTACAAPVHADLRHCVAVQPLQPLHTASLVVLHALS